MITRVWLRAHPLPADGAPGGVHVPVVRRRDRGLPDACSGAARHRRCCGCTTRSRPRAATAATARQSLLLVLDEGDPAIVEATMAVVADACAGGHAGVRRPRRRAGSSTATTRRPCRRSPARASSSTRWRSPPRGPDSPSCSRRSAPRCSRCRTPWSRRATCRTAIRTAPACTSRSPPPPPAGRGRGDLRRALGRRPAGRARPRRQPLPPPRRRDQPGPVRRRGARARRRRVLAAVKAALDPLGILNPGKLGLDSPFGPAPWPSRGDGELGLGCDPGRRARRPRLRRAVLDRRPLGRRQP